MRRHFFLKHEKNICTCKTLNLGKRYPPLKRQSWTDFNSVRLANKCINRKNWKSMSCDSNYRWAPREIQQTDKSFPSGPALGKAVELIILPSFFPVSNILSPSSSFCSTHPSPPCCDGFRDSRWPVLTAVLLIEENVKCCSFEELLAFLQVATL